MREDGNMFNRITQDWLLETYTQSTEMEGFMQKLGVDTENANIDNGNEILKAIELGIRGDRGMHRQALDYIENMGGVRIWEVDRTLLESEGLDAVFITALLHSFGPFSNTADWLDDPEEDIIRGVLTILFNDHKTTKKRTAVSLQHTMGAWELQISFDMTRDIRWATDFRGDAERDAPDIEVDNEYLPDSLIATLPGKPLSEVIKHPHLEKFNLEIEGGQNTEDGYILNINKAGRGLNYNDLKTLQLTNGKILT